ncbi:MAG TPA: hypothetical protein VFD30_20295 [Terriglobia bacterium]|nr:hypothetical protein [Terriglobia bacterium]
MTGEQRIELAMRKALDNELDQLVEAARRAILLLNDDRAMRENQIRNVLNVATSTESLAVVTNFIRYQMGRSGGNQAWLHSNFGQTVVNDLESEKGEVAKLAESVTRKVCEKTGSTDRNRILGRARVELARLYLGYLNRWFYYGSKKPEHWNDIAAVKRAEYV